jgi:hypothetical protein
MSDNFELRAGRVKARRSAKWVERAKSVDAVEQSSTLTMW